MGGSELKFVGMLFLAFALLLMLYGLILKKTGNVELLPYRAQWSIADKEDVRRVGRITINCGLVTLALSVLAIIVGS